MKNANIPRLFLVASSVVLITVAGCRTVASPCDRTGLLDAIYSSAGRFEASLSQVFSAVEETAEVPVDGILQLTFERMAFMTRYGIRYAPPGVRPESMAAVEVVVSPNVSFRINGREQPCTDLDQLPDAEFFEVHGIGLLEKSGSWDGKSLVGVRLVLRGELEIQPLSEAQISCLFLRR